VKIDLHHQLLAWRRELAHHGQLAWSKRYAMKAASVVFRSVTLYRLAGSVARWLVPKMPRFLIYNRFNAWGKQRELPPFPAKSFRQMYKERHGKPG
jgi:L-lactate dehydrogenase complex protein LldF